MGAQFEAADYAVSGSGSPAVRSILYYANTWGGQPLRELSREEAVILALRALDTAADTDTATGGVDRRGPRLPHREDRLRGGHRHPRRKRSWRESSGRK